MKEYTGVPKKFSASFRCLVVIFILLHIKCSRVGGCLRALDCYENRKSVIVFELFFS